MFRELVAPSFRSRLMRFSHIWITDEDVLFPPAEHVLRYVKAVQALQLPLAQPAVQSSTHRMLQPWSRAAPSSQRNGRAPLASTSTPCSVKFTDFVEVMSPLLQTCAFLDVFLHLYEPAHASDWGLDRLWCRFLAARWRIPLCTTCAAVESGGTFEKLWGRQHVSSFKYEEAHADDLCLRARMPTWDSRCVTFRTRAFECGLRGPRDPKKRSSIDWQGLLAQQAITLRDRGCVGLSNASGMTSKSTCGVPPVKLPVQL